MYTDIVYDTCNEASSELYLCLHIIISTLSLCYYYQLLKAQNREICLPLSNGELECAESELIIL